MEWQVIWSNLPTLLTGLRLTIVTSLIGLTTSLVLGGALVALGRSRLRFLVVLVRIYTEFILGIPILVLLYVVFFVFPQLGILLEPFAAGILTLTLYYSPYMAEVIRGAFNAIPSGHLEAGQVIGMSRWDIVRRIILPQALGLGMPPMTGIFIGLIKDSSILSIISIAELTFETKQVVSRTYAPFETYAVAALLYWMLNFALDNGMRQLERRLTRYRAV
jgi:His/Glu/Gln/Arg/opine family amino acid ABC transporter permease subunit